MVIKWTILFMSICVAAHADNYALVDGSGIVQNIIVWDGVSPYTPPPGQNPVLAGTGAAVGGTYSSGLLGGTFTPPAPPTLTAMQQAATALSSGLSITSTGTPSLNGTYSLDQTNQNNVSATTTYILLNGTFPGGGTTMSWIDQSGVAHTWPNVAEFKAFATVYANFVAAVALYAASNGASGSLPSNQVTIP